MSEKLLPCPFCGANPHHGLTKVMHCQLHGDPYQNFRIWCPHKCAQVECGNEPRAAKKWNTRAAMQADADLERIKRERDQAAEALRLFVKLMNDPDYDLGELCEEFCTRAETILASIEGAGHE